VGAAPGTSANARRCSRAVLTPLPSPNPIGGQHRNIRQFQLVSSLSVALLTLWQSSFADMDWLQVHLPAA
jgi:hypothetical protein